MQVESRLPVLSDDMVPEGITVLLSPLIPHIETGGKERGKKWVLEKQLSSLVNVWF